MKHVIGILFILSVLISSCKKEETSPNVMVTNVGTMASDTIGRGPFTSYQHNLSGSALLYTDVNAEKILKLENFNMTAGPDVYMYLSTTASYSAANVLEITKLTTGYTNSTLNYTVAGYESKYKYVLVYCVTYSALFGYVQLN